MICGYCDAKQSVGWASLINDTATVGILTQSQIETTQILIDTSACECRQRQLSFVEFETQGKIEYRIDSLCISHPNRQPIQVSISCQRSRR